MRYCTVFALFFIGLQACDRPAPVNSSKTFEVAINKQIADGKRLENSNKDSLPAIAEKLFTLYKQSGNKKALVHAELYNGMYYWQSAQKQKAMQNAITALADAEKYHITDPMPDIHSLIGNLHKEAKNYKLAFTAAENGYKAAVSNRDTGQMISTLGLNAMFKRGQTLNNHTPKLKDSSLQLNLAALKIAESSPKYERLRTRFYDNIAQYYKDHLQLDSAIDYAGRGVANATRFDQKRSLTYAYSWLGEAYYFRGEHEKGIGYLEQARKIASDLHQAFRVMEITESFYNCYESSGNYKDAMHYYALSRNMRDSLKVLDNVKQLGDLQIKYETAKKDVQIQSLQSGTEIAAQRLITAIAIAVLLAVIVVLAYIRQKNTKKLLLLEQRVVQDQLEIAKVELVHFTGSIKHQNEIIEEFKTEIEFLQGRTETLANSEGLEKLLAMHIMTDENWENFKKLFTKVHTNFFTLVKKQYPNITAVDMRILSLIKLELTNAEIAPMLGITTEGVRKSKQRLRKKMDLDAEATIESIVMAI